jgi:hypothetical protein
LEENTVTDVLAVNEPARKYHVSATADCVLVAINSFVPLPEIANSNLSEAFFLRMKILRFPAVLHLEMMGESTPKLAASKRTQAIRLTTPVKVDSVNPPDLLCLSVVPL